MNIYKIVWYDGVASHTYVITAEDLDLATAAVAAIHVVGYRDSWTLLGAAQTGP